ncbi:C45 family autoproteolytic acyltransferase/hydolase [Vibrio sp. F74]|uniref:C45 family autoproteolytic acyltransferase/hydolase n=1 Tax=Vibrio sp. F74 TaxID=700020 RepID=UPI0035F55176
MRVISFEGTPYELGYKLGQEGKSIFASYIKNSQYFTQLLPWRESDWLSSVDQQIQQQFPRIYRELQGLADGCQQDYKDILLWNCRGDLLPTGAEGCTSIAIKKADRIIVAHNEDGDPNLRGHCFLLDATLDNNVRIFSFAYPGSIPGHTLCANSHGLVYTVNNIRLVEQGSGLPRMVISRALLETKNCDDFVSLLENHQRSGGFHYTVADTASKQLLSVEAPFQSVSAQRTESKCVHANHLVHNTLSSIKQIITESSQCRQNRMEALAEHYSDSIDEDKCFHILQDIEIDALPIFRTEIDDPDEENTLATGVFTLRTEGVEIVIYGMEDFKNPVKNQFTLN